MRPNLEVKEQVSELERTLERALDAAFRPVGPRPEYLDHLRDRLMQEPDRTDDHEQAMATLLAGVGVISVLLLILASVKWVQSWRRLRSQVL